MPRSSCVITYDGNPFCIKARGSCSRGSPSSHVPSQKQEPLQLRQVPRGEVFQPPRRYLKHLEPMDFLGKAKVKP